MDRTNVAALVGTTVIVAWVCWMPAPRLWWGALPAFAWGAAVMAEAWSVASWWRRGRRASLPVAAALVLAGIDVAALAELAAGAAQWPLVEVAGWCCWGLMLGIAVAIRWRCT